jgi:hypothetical protein
MRDRRAGRVQLARNTAGVACGVDVTSSGGRRVDTGAEASHRARWT